MVVWLFWLQVDAEWENVDLLRPVHRCPRGHAVMNWGFRTCSIMPRTKDHSLLGRSFPVVEFGYKWFQVDAKVGCVLKLVVWLFWLQAGAGFGVQFDAEVGCLVVKITGRRLIS